MNHRFHLDELQTFAVTLLHRAGLPLDRAGIVAGIFLEADLLGYSTHGLNRLPSNLEWLENGETRAAGDVTVLIDTGPVLNWDANLLPGPYVVSLGVDVLCDRAVQYGVATLTMRRSQHIACLAAYLRRATERGLVIQIVASSPGDRNVCAHGGLDRVFSPNPFAFGAPTGGDPILIDFSLSVVAEGQVARARRLGTRMQSQCLKDHDGNLSNDPGDYWDEPRGSILPMGGADHGHKGYGLCLWSELITMALGNYGRSQQLPFGEQNSVFIQVTDPAVFGSLEAFQAEAGYLARLCRNSRVKAGAPPVRVAGDRALELRREQLKNGIALAPQILEDLGVWAEKLAVTMPSPLP